MFLLQSAFLRIEGASTVYQQEKKRREKKLLAPLFDLLADYSSLKINSYCHSVYFCTTCRFFIKLQIVSALVSSCGEQGFPNKINFLSYVYQNLNIRLLQSYSFELSTIMYNFPHDLYIDTTKCLHIKPFEQLLFCQIELPRFKNGRSKTTYSSVF